MGKTRAVVLGFLFAALGAASLPLHGKEADGIVLPPVGPWQLDMAENSCRLARVFGTAGEETVFIIEQFSPGSTARWMVAGSIMKRFRERREMSFAFGPDGASGEFTPTGASLGEWGPAVDHASPIAFDPDFDRDDDTNDEPDYVADPRGLPMLDAEGAGSVEQLDLMQNGRDPVVLKLGKMAPPVAAFNVCMNDLVKSWGFDPVEQARVQSPPQVTNMANVAQSIMNHFPRKAERRGEQADFHLRLTIGTTGQIEDCKLLNMTLAENFDMSRHPCKTFKDIARIEPARTASGDPVRSFYTTRILYRMN